MDIVRTGIILNVEKFDECVTFYKNLFDLKVLLEEQFGGFRLTCFEFGDSYLMVETDGFAKPEGKTLRENSTKLRFNVSNLEEALKTINAYGIEAKIIESDWGSTINIYDPDGNRVGIRDEATFKSQIGA
jgi:lactoylglutathione lyase